MMHVIASVALLAYTAVIYRLGTRRSRAPRLDPLQWSALDTPAVWRRNLFRL